ncbi:MAG: RnfABCDGE type electron transport complex subunit A [Ruminococcaceae bacterium]|nr:RnfABCDGE type electron transport complex subunit A [Oscillospiraceae bacterium]
MKELLVILFSAILTDNVVLSRFMGICPFLGVSNKTKSAVGMGIAVILVMTVSTIVTYPIATLILIPNGLSFLNTIVFILVIASFVQLVEMVLKKFMPPLYSALGIYLPLITTNCAVLGITLINIEDFSGMGEFLPAIVNAIGAGVGFLMAMVIFSGVRTRLNCKKIPKSFQGLPISLVAAAIVAISFMGFSGVIDGIFSSASESIPFFLK